jgi:SAM-dependent methyltransferase
MPWLRRLLPRGVRDRLRAVDAAIDPIRVSGYRRRTGDRRPVPPPILRERVGASTIASYFETAERYAAAVERGLECVGRSMDDVRSMLDFGAGAGKVLQALGPRMSPDATLHASDLHGPSIDWIRCHLPDVDARANGYEPPLPWPQDQIDCAYVWSVFTHIDRSMQIAWLDELRRVLAPGGTLLCSFISPSHPRFAQLSGGLTASEVEAAGLVFRPYGGGGVSYREFSGTTQPYGLTFQSVGYTRALWGEALEVVDVVERGLDGCQDVIVLRA